MRLRVCGGGAGPSASAQTRSAPPAWCGRPLGNPPGGRRAAKPTSRGCSGKPLTLRRRPRSELHGGGSGRARGCLQSEGQPGNQEGQQPWVSLGACRALRCRLQVSEPGLVRGRRRSRSRRGKRSRGFQALASRCTLEEPPRSSPAAGSRAAGMNDAILHRDVAGARSGVGARPAGPSFPAELGCPGSTCRTRCRQRPPRGRD